MTAGCLELQPASANPTTKVSKSNRNQRPLVLHWDREAFTLMYLLFLSGLDTTSVAVLHGKSLFPIRPIIGSCYDRNECAQWLALVAVRVVLIS